MKGKAKMKKKRSIEKARKRETEINKHEGGKEGKKELDGTLAASACSQEDYSSTRCHRLPARPQRSSLNGDIQTYCCRCLPVCILVSFLPVPCPPSFTQFYCPFCFLHLSFLHLFPACSPFFHSHSPSASLSLSLQPFQVAVRGEV